MKTNRVRWIVAAVLTAVLLFAVVLAGWLGDRRQPEFSRLEQEELFGSDDNGYRYFLDASTLVVPFDEALQTELDNLENLEQIGVEIRDFLKRNEEALRGTRRGLDMELCIAPPYRHDDPQLRLDVLARFRTLARALMYQGKVDGLDGDVRSMIENYLDALRLGRSIMRGGVTIDGMVGIAIQRPALDAIHDALQRLAEDDLRHVVETMEESERRAVSSEEILANERNTIQMNPILRWQVRKIISPAIRRFEDDCAMADVMARGTLLRARVQLFKLHHGAAPESLSDVMDGRDVPIDRFSGKPFRYVNDKIYSFGWDRDDDQAAVNARKRDADGDRVF